MENTPYPKSRYADAAEVVCFGSITPAIVLTVAQLPPQNTGAVVKQSTNFISEDAAIIACLLRGWNIRSGIIGTAVGADHRGQWTVDRFKALGVLGDIRIDPNLVTPFEVDISDAAGARTFFWERKPEIIATLNTADLSLLKGSHLLYIDWYDGPAILRPMEAAMRLDIPVFLNLEHGHEDDENLTRYAAKATICQVVTDAAQQGEVSPETIAQKLLKIGVQIAIVTLAKTGCLVADQTKMIRVSAPVIQAVDACGAGATFSAGFIYGFRQAWGLEKTARFAIAAASLKCTQIGLETPKLEACLKLASELKLSIL